MMAGQALQPALEKLQARPDSMPWPERLKLCQSLHAALNSGASLTTALELLDLLANDPKWEVRREVARSLEHMSQDDLLRLGAQLALDQNDFVRQAAKKVMERRKRLAREREQGRRSADEIEQQLQALGSKFGPAAAKKMRRLCERYSELVIGSIVHDLRSIYAHLKSNCFSLVAEARNGSSGTQIKRSAKNVEDDLVFLERTIHDMETFTQSANLDRRTERLSELISAGVNLARKNLRKDGLDTEAVKVRVSAPDSMTVHVDRHHIVLALANVIKNAFESFSTKSGQCHPGRIRITGALVADMAQIAVQDNGRGLSEEEKQVLSISTPGRKNKSKRHSTGYGLPTAIKALTAHGGRMDLKSQENKGTTVTITLPVKPGEE